MIRQWDKGTLITNEKAGITENHVRLLKQETLNLFFFLGHSQTLA